ncbi:MAG: glycosyltransferase family 4 protein [Chlamydiota bacterium]
MRIALIHRKGQKPGGVERFAEKIRQFLEKEGWTVSHLHEGAFSLPKTRLRRKKAFDQACARFVHKQASSLQAVLSLEKIDCNPTHLRLGEGLHATYLQKRAHFESFLKRWHLRQSRFHRHALAVEKKCLENPRLKTLFCNAEMVKQEVLAHYQIPPEKIVVIQNGINWSEYEGPFASWRDEKVALHRRYDLPSCFHFLFVGNGFVRKGLWFLLQAFAALPKNTHLSVVGRCKTLPSCKRFVRKHKLENRVRFFGAQNPTPFYQLADCLVIPSYYDPAANVTLEALAMGLRVVSSTANGAAEILPPTWRVDKPEDPRVLQQALLAALPEKKTEESATKKQDLVRSFCDQKQLRKFVQHIRPV